jgi:hypothetical protein
LVAVVAVVGLPGQMETVARVGQLLSVLVVTLLLLAVPVA